MFTWGKEGRAPGEFRKPSGLAIDKNDNVYVAEIGNNRIQKFNAKGEFLYMFGKNGKEPGEWFGYQSHRRALCGRYGESSGTGIRSEVMGGEGNRFMMSSLDINNLSISNKFSLPSACYALGLLVIVVTMGIFYHSHRVSSELIIDLTEQKNILSKFRASVAGIDQDLVRLVYLYHQDREESILANVESLAPMLVEFKELADKHDFINDRSLAEEIEPSIEELRRISLEIVGLNLDTMIAPARDLYKYSFLVRAEFGYHDSPCQRSL